MNDRELIELAGKACGLGDLLQWDDASGCVKYPYPSELTDGHLWNPLSDDGDALRLAVRLELDLTRNLYAVAATGRSPTHGTPGEHLTIREDFKSDPYAATRRAIVRAAAEIGKGL